MGPTATAPTATASQPARRVVHLPNGGRLYPWAPGESGNPAGRGLNPGLGLIEEVARMWPWGMDRIEEAAQDRSGSSSRQVAGQMLVAMRDGEWDKVGRQPRALQTLLAWMDRWLGKVPERVELAVARVKVPDTLEQLVALAAADPTALALLRQVVDQAESQLEAKSDAEG